MPHCVPDNSLPFAHPSPGCVLAQSFLLCDAQHLARWGCRGSDWNPSLGLENRSGVGAPARRFGQGPGQGGGMVIRAV